MFYGDCGAPDCPCTDGNVCPTPHSFFTTNDGRVLRLRSANAFGDTPRGALAHGGGAGLGFGGVASSADGAAAGSSVGARAPSLAVVSSGPQ